MHDIERKYETAPMRQNLLKTNATIEENLKSKNNYDSDMNRAFFARSTQNFKKSIHLSQVQEEQMSTQRLKQIQAESSILQTMTCSDNNSRGSTSRLAARMQNNQSVDNYA